MGDHRADTKKQLKELDVLKKQATLSVEEVTTCLLESVNQGVAQVYQNQQKLDGLAKALQGQTVRFAKQTNKWVTMYRNLNAALLELGDVTNWAQTMESDMNIIASSLENVVKMKEDLGHPVQRAHQRR